jgi:ABC-2 type transport system permease protein
MTAITALGRRAMLVQFRRFQLLMPTFVLPLMLLAVISSGTGAAQDLPGFPTVSSHVSFVVAGTIVQGALLAGLTSGIQLAGDIESGFFDRLLAAPVARSSLVLGRLVGTVALGAIQTAFFLAIAFVFGARYPGGPVAIALVLVLAPVTAAALGGVASAIALRTGSMSLLQSIFPFMFVLLFTAPAFFPRGLLSPTLHDIAVYNPLTYVVEGVRGLLSDDPSQGTAWKGFVAAGSMLVFTTWLATFALAERLRRT